MIKIFQTGDLHLGKKYDSNGKHPKAKEIAENRIETLLKMVKMANEEHCDLFVICGDLFDKTKGIADKVVKKVVEHLSMFDGNVVILPGNHDYYDVEQRVEVWSNFEKHAEEFDNILLLTKFEKYEMEIGNNKIGIYPAFCECLHSDKNNLEWIKNTPIENDGSFHIGVAHGTVDGYSRDDKNCYFKMESSELNDIPVDAWLIGHTHVAFPELSEDFKETSKIFNPGTHVQTDINNNTKGNAFIISLSKNDKNITELKAKKVNTGDLFFKEINVKLKGTGSESELRDTLIGSLKDVDINTSISLNISGPITESELKNRQNIYSELTSKFLELSDVKDNDLTELITEDYIKRKYPETSFPAKLLLKLLNDPRAIYMAKNILDESNNTKGVK